MDHTLIDTFMTVARTRNVSQAAEQLNLSQSAVSKRVKMLEQEIGIILFERVKGNKTFCLTPAGESFIDLAERWLAVWRETQSFQFKNPKLSLSIGTLDSLNYAFLPRLYQALSRHQPRLNLKIITSHSRDLYDFVDRREVDVAFSLLRWEHPNIIVEKCFREPMVGLRMSGKSTKESQSTVVYPHELDPNDELFVYWGPTYQIWHDQWWEPVCPGRILLDTAQLIFSFFYNPRQWAIVPLSVAEKACKTGRYTKFCFSADQPDRICYKISHKYPKASTLESLKVLDTYLSSLYPGELQGNSKK
jgi:DNA-binding transcriptional LysR family regulator